jgi:Flp pilus assembly protein TadB
MAGSGVNAIVGAAYGGLIGFGVFCALAAFTSTKPTEDPRPPAARPLAWRVDRGGLRAATALLGAVAGAATGWPVAVVLGAVGGAAAPSLVGRRAGRERALARTEALAAWTESLRDLIAAGSAIESTITESARVAPAPIRAEVRALADRLGNNEDLDDALAAFAADLDDPLGDLVVTAVATASSRQGGANLTAVLGAAARAARAQVAMRHQIEAARAGTYTSARVVVGVFAAFTVGLLLFNRSFLDPFGTAAGQVVLCIIGGLFALCAVAMARLAEPERPERFYRSIPPGELER